MSRLAVDLRTYQGLSQVEAEWKFRREVGSVVLEAAKDHPRVVCWQTTADQILQGLDPEDPTTADTFLVASLMGEKPEAIVWSSPPDSTWDRPESRVNFYLNENEGLYRCYSISLPETVEWQISAGPLETIKQLVAGMEKAWEYIQSGEAQIRQNEALEAAQILAPAVIHWLHTYQDPIVAGALGELAMSNAGFRMRLRGSGCGLSNLEQLNSLGYSSMTPIPKFHSETTTCPEISCPACGWKPSERQVKEINTGQLTHCPDCGYNP